MTTGGKVNVLSCVLMLKETSVVVSSRVCVGPGMEISTVCVSEIVSVSVRVSVTVATTVCVEIDVIPDSMIVVGTYSVVTEVVTEV